MHLDSFNFSLPEVNSFSSGKLKFKSELSCKIGDVETAVETAIKAYAADTCDIYTLPYIGFLYSKLGNEAKSSDYLEMAIKNFEIRCSENCNDSDLSNLLFLKLYTNKISNTEFVTEINKVGEEYNYMADIYSNFNKGIFLSNLCK